MMGDRSMNARALYLLGLGIGFLGACAPGTQFKSANDPSAEVKLKPAGMNTSSDGKASSQAGRLNVDCFTENVDADRVSDGSPIKALGIPSNCPNVSNSSSATSTTAKHDVAVVLDTSENMIPFIASAKKELDIALRKLQAEQRIGSLGAFAFRGSVSATEKGADIVRTIDLLTGTSAEWTSQALKVIDPTSTAWINNDAAKGVYPALEQATAHLKAGSNINKILILLTASTAKGTAGFDVAPGAKILSDLQSSVASKGGQLVFNYAASDKLARGLSEYAPHAFEQLNALSSVAALNPVKALMPASLGGWGEAIVSRASTPATSNENCIMTKLEGFDAAETSVFKKTFDVKDKNGLQEASLPQLLQGVSFSLKVTRKCDKSGETTQTIVVKTAKESVKK
jgi:hypothetical protein